MISRRFRYDGKPCISLNNIQKVYKDAIEKKIREGFYSFESKECPVCLSMSFKIISEKDRYGLPMSVSICEKCGLVQTNPRMTEESYRQFYGKEQKPLYTAKEIPSNEYFCRQVDRGRKIKLKIESFLGRKITGENVLEVGCSSGGILQSFKLADNRVFGCDINSEYAEYGKNKYGLDLRVGTINDINLPGSPDLIIYSHTLEHILNPIEELNKIRKLSSHRTLLYIELPGIKNLWRSYGRDLLEYLQAAHVYHFSLTSIKNMLKKTGWVIETGDETLMVIASAGYTDSHYVKDRFIYAYLKRMEYLRLIPTPYRIGYILRKCKK